MERTSQKSATVRWGRVLLYYLLVCTVSYGLVGAFFALGGGFDDSSWVFFAQASAITPAITAIVLTRFVWRDPLRDSLGLRLQKNRWLLVAWLAPWTLSLLALALGLAVPGVSWDSSLQPAVDATILSPEQLEVLHGLSEKTSLPPYLFLFPMGILLSVTMSFIAGCGEEVGWRGFMHGELRALGFWRNALITGLFWLVWHLPLVALGYGNNESIALGMVLMTVHIMVSSVSLAYLRERTSSSLAVGLFHGTTEATILLAVAPLKGGSGLYIGSGSLTWIGADFLIMCAFLAHDRFISKSPIAFRRGLAD